MLKLIFRRHLKKRCRTPQKGFPRGSETLIKVLAENKFQHLDRKILVKDVVCMSQDLSVKMLRLIFRRHLKKRCDTPQKGFLRGSATLIKVSAENKFQHLDRKMLVKDVV